MSSLTSAFEAIRQSSIPYAVIQGFLNGPRMEPKQMSILTTNAERFARIIEAEKHPDKACVYVIPGIRTEFFIMQKGSGFFPEPFETEILQRSELHDGMRRPCNHDIMAARLYWMLHREGAWKSDPEFANVVSMFLENHVGHPCPPPDELLEKFTPQPTFVMG